MSRRLLAAALVTSLMLGACGNDDAVGAGRSSTTTTEAGAGTGTNEAPAGTEGPEVVTVTGAIDEKPEIELNGLGPVEELFTDDLAVGEGDEVGAGDTIEAHYVGVTLDGEQFDASWDRGAPSEFSLDEVIAGWTEGIPGMRVGGRRLLVIPVDLAYGESAADLGKPAGTLVFVVDIVSIVARAPEPVDPVGDGSGVVAVTGAFGDRPVVALNGVAPVTELVVEDVIVGAGAEVTATATLQIQGLLLLLDGSVANATWDTGGPISLVMGEAAEALAQGLPGMRVGGRRLLLVPSALLAAEPGEVPGDTLVFVIDVLEVSPQ